jgi:hypothetical protein
MTYKLIGILISLGLSLYFMAYLRWLLIPILLEARHLITLRQRNCHLDRLIEGGQIQVNSSTYWQAIEKMVVQPFKVPQN